MVRNCHRCTKDFEATGGERVCAGCRRPPDYRRPVAINRNLSVREKQVTLLVCKALPNKQIGYELHLTEGTIKEYLNRIFQKTGVGSRTELAMWAVRTKLWEPPGVPVTVEIFRKGETLVPRTRFASR